MIWLLLVVRGSLTLLVIYSMEYYFLLYFQNLHNVIITHPFQGGPLSTDVLGFLERITGYASISTRF
jgi:hypothetical protein